MNRKFALLFGSMLLPFFAAAQDATSEKYVGTSKEALPYPQIINVSARTPISLDGWWKVIPDQYESGYYNYRLVPFATKQTYFADLSFSKDRTRLVEYDFDMADSLMVPGDWNTQKEKFYYYEGTIWYRKKFDYSLKPDRRVFLYFGGANYETIVGVNGRKIGKHTGGFTPFNFEITDMIKDGENSVIAKVDNRRRPEGVPTINTDWWNYGGITRNVCIIETPETFIRDYSVQLNYLNFMLDLPWDETTNDNFDINNAKKILDADHYGLDKVKQRILEYLAVLKLKNNIKSPVLCLVGPPGVGKTSLGKSIARAVGRKYVRIALGGLSDESEIRGHRRTYIGAMPGRILKSISKCKSSNPVFVLDEIDKVMGMSANGDPASAMLEVLDPEQNTSFHDNYLDIDYDLSKVMFIATANSLANVHPALIDRMEVIDISGYIEQEKLMIAKKHLFPKQLEEHGMTKKQLSLSDSLISILISKYTRESGVRQLDKVIAKIVRYRAVQIVKEEEYKKAVKESELYQILGLPIAEHDSQLEENRVGVVTGLAWTAVGGEILFIEASKSNGKGNLSLTGNLGDVMKESATLAYEFIKSNAADLGVDEDIFEKINIYVHVPEGATPKDGPSAGITIFTAILSVLLDRKVRTDFAMTGEITLRGLVLPVGGIKEKILAAKRSKITNIILSEKNRRDIEDINAKYLEGLKFHYVKSVMEISDMVFVK